MILYRIKNNENQTVSKVNYFNFYVLFNLPIFLKYNIPKQLFGTFQIFFKKYYFIS